MCASRSSGWFRVAPLGVSCGVTLALAVSLLGPAASAAERELNLEPPPSSVGEIETPIERVFEERRVRRPVAEWLREQLEGLPPFFADTQLEARYRTYYLDKDRTGGSRSEAWAMGGSLYYRSGWLAETLQLEVEGFTSQPIVTPRGRDGTLLLEDGQNGYSVLGIANAKLRCGGLVLTGFRQYLDLPYVNRNDSRMTPNTFESITLTRPEGALRFSTGYSFRIKPRNSDTFESFTEALDLDRDRGLVHAGIVWDPESDFHSGVVWAMVPDLFSGVYTELGMGRELADGLEGRVDGQFTYQWDVGDDLLGADLGDTWVVGARASVSYAVAVFRLGFNATGSGAANRSLYGANPAYVDLMQRTFTAESEKAVIISLSYDFEGIGAPGLTSIVNFVTAFDGERLGAQRDAQELDLTFDYRLAEDWLERSWLQSLWLRVRASWLYEEDTGEDGTDVRVILRYDFPVV